MRSITRLALVALLSAGLCNLSVMAAAGTPLGMVVNAENAHLSEATATLGTNVFAGDSLQTDPDGTLRVRVGSNQVYLAAASFAMLLQHHDNIRVKLDRGTVGFSSPAASHFEIETPVGIIRGANGKAAFGEVTIVGPGKIMVAAYHGAIVVSNAGFERTIAEGNAYNVSLAQGPEGAGTGNGSDDNSGNTNNVPQQAIHNYEPLVFTAIIMGTLAGLGYLVWHYANESDPSPPSN